MAINPFLTLLKLLTLLKQKIATLSPQDLRTKMRILAVSMVCFPTLIIAYFVEVQGRDALLQEKQAKLYGITKLLDTELGNDFDHLSLTSGLSRQQQIQYLNTILQDKTEAVARFFPNVAAGYYSKALDAIITYAPQEENGNKVGITISSEHPGRKVMELGKPLVETGNQVRGNIMNAMLPIVRDGEILGYIWANELITSIEKQTAAMDISITVVISIGLLFSLLFISVLSRRFSDDIDTIKIGLKELPFNLQAKLPRLKGEIGEIADSVNTLAKALRETKTINELVLDSAVDGVITIDTHGCVTMLNPAAQRITGFQLEEIIGKPYASLFNDHNFQSPLLDTLQKGRDHVGVEIDYPVLDKIIKISASTSHLRNSDGESIGAVVIFKDLTEKKEIQQRLDQAERLAAIGELMAGIAHEVRNPLTAIRGFVQYLQQDTDKNERLEYTNIIIKEVDSINKVIQQLLDFAKLPSSIYQPVSLAELIEQTLVLVKTSQISQRVEFVVNLDQELSDIHVDREMLKQVLLNLLINAIQAITTSGRITINTRLSSNRFQVIEVIDTGCGISEAIKNKIFTPFFTTKSSGTGLGLAFSQRVISAHGGDIFLKNYPVGGAIATLILPITPAKGE